jgi:valyl-tRNA synthetase
VVAKTKDEALEEFWKKKHLDESCSETLKNPASQHQLEPFLSQEDDVMDTWFSSSGLMAYFSF